MPSPRKATLSETDVIARRWSHVIDGSTRMLRGHNSCAAYVIFVNWMAIGMTIGMTILVTMMKGG